MSDQPIVKDLKALLDVHEKDDWRGMLHDSVLEARALAIRRKLKGADKFPDSLDGKGGYYDYLNKMVKWIPREDIPKEVLFMLCKFYWLIDQPSGRALQKEDDFNEWMHRFAISWGSFLDTPESASGISSFLNNEDFHIGQYIEGPSGWLTFNEFFARQVRPGLRPVTGLFDDDIICSPADSTFKAKFPIDADGEVTIKFTHKYKILDLLEKSPYRERFNGGLFMHSFLGPNDYHRFHAPVSGTVLECRSITGRVYLDVQINNGQFEAPDGAGYEFTQERGLIIFESPIGLVAVLPIGMAQVSSVNMTAVEGAYLVKGSEFGYFKFGGSDIIMLFEEESNVNIHAAPGIHYLCGQGIAEKMPED